MSGRPPSCATRASGTRSPARRCNPRRPHTRPPFGSAGERPGAQGQRHHRDPRATRRRAALLGLAVQIAVRNPAPSSLAPETALASSKLRLGSSVCFVGFLFFWPLFFCMSPPKAQPSSRGSSRPRSRRHPLPVQQYLFLSVPSPRHRAGTRQPRIAQTGYPAAARLRPGATGAPALALAIGCYSRRDAIGTRICSLEQEKKMKRNKVK